MTAVAAARLVVSRGTGSLSARGAQIADRPWLALGFAVVAAINAIGLVSLATWPHLGSDWEQWTRLPLTASPYPPILNSEGIPTIYRYSPIAVWALAPLLVAIGPVVWAGLHVAALLTLPRYLAALVVLSFPFWVDTLYGNVFVFVFVAAYWAMLGDRRAVLGFLVLTMLMPRPVQVPLAVWFLWREPWVRVPFAALFVAHLGIVTWTGYGPAWLSRLLESGAGEMSAWYNFGPTRLFGFAWLVVGLPLAAVLFWRSHPALAGLVAAPYLLAQYWLLGYVTLPRNATSKMGELPLS